MNRFRYKFHFAAIAFAFALAGTLPNWPAVAASPTSKNKHAAVQQDMTPARPMFKIRKDNVQHPRVAYAGISRMFARCFRKQICRKWVARRMRDLGIEAAYSKAEEWLDDIGQQIEASRQAQDAERLNRLEHLLRIKKPSPAV